ncbi:hypothetical protein AAC387_Pa08g1570 [Persea americana]
MEENYTSWVRRAKFSHTVCHRWDPSRLQSLPFDLQRKSLPVLKPVIPNTGSVTKPCDSPAKQRSKSPLPETTQRSKSPLPKTVLSEAFQEARANSKRFSTPPRLRRRDHDKLNMGRLFSGHAQDSHIEPANTSTLQKFSLMKASEEMRKKMESSWTKYLDHRGGRVSAVDTMEEWTVDLSKLFLGFRFASGAHSKLYRGIYKDQPVAVKMIRIPDDDENRAMEARLEKQFTREVTVLSHLHHQNVIRLVAACRKPPVFCIITEFLSGGSLRAFLHKLERKALPLKKLIAVSLDIARASCDSLAEDPGTYRWMAPEMIKHKVYGRKVDVYSFGLVLWEMVTGTIPYEEMTPIQAAFAVVNKNSRPVIPTDCPASLRALIEQCWSLDPEKRPEFWQIVKVLEQFESSLAQDGTLNLVQTSTCQDHKNGLVRWIQKLGHVNPNRLTTRKHS